MKRKPVAKTKSLRRQMRDTVKAHSKKKVKKGRPIISTGSTLLDLAATGTAIYGGGLWGGLAVEIFGENSTGKTTVIAEACGNAQRAGGEVYIDDAEARLSRAYCKKMGITLNKKFLRRPDTVEEVFDFIIGPLKTIRNKKKRQHDKAWLPRPNHVNIYGLDSIAALSTWQEIDSEDKRGQDKPKQLSQGFRKSMRHMKRQNILLFLSNQVRDSMQMYGESTKPTGGHAIGFYTSLRIRLTLIRKLVKEVKVPGSTKKVKRYYGIEVDAFIYKSNIDIPFRKAKLFITFNYGIDDIRGNLWWLKEHGLKFEDKKIAQLDKMVKYVEDNNLEKKLRERVITKWLEVEEQLTPKRKPKERF